jgi:hypothetical protein
VLTSDLESRQKAAVAKPKAAPKAKKAPLASKKNLPNDSLDEGSPNSADRVESDVNMDCGSDIENAPKKVAKAAPAGKVKSASEMYQKVSN